MPSLDGAFCGVGVAIDCLKVWQAPKINDPLKDAFEAYAPGSAESWR
jgi:hypothetical protein